MVVRMRLTDLRDFRRNVKKRLVEIIVGESSPISASLESSISRCSPTADSCHWQQNIWEMNRNGLHILFGFALSNFWDALLIMTVYIL